MGMETAKTKTSEPIWFPESTKNEKVLICRDGQRRSETGKGSRQRLKKIWKGYRFDFLASLFFGLCFIRLSGKSISEREQVEFVEKKPDPLSRRYLFISRGRTVGKQVFLRGEKEKMNIGTHVAISLTSFFGHENQLPEHGPSSHGSSAPVSFIEDVKFVI